MLASRFKSLPAQARSGLTVKGKLGEISAPRAGFI